MTAPCRWQHESTVLVCCSMFLLLDAQNKRRLAADMHVTHTGIVFRKSNFSDCCVAGGDTFSGLNSLLFLL